MSSQKTAIVTGASGLLGRAVYKEFEKSYKVVGTGLTRAQPPLVKLDLLDHEAVASLIEQEQPSVVIHCAAERRPDVSEKQQEYTEKLNVKATRKLAEAAAKSASKPLVIYISTDYVFDGQNAPYEVDDKTNPTNWYGHTKLNGELAILESPNTIALRIPVLYGAGENSESSINTLVDAVWNKAGKKDVQMDHWAARFPTNVEDVAHVLKDLAQKYSTEESRKDQPRVFQFSADQKYTKYEICQIFGDILGLPIDHLIAQDTVEQTPGVIRPRDCKLSTKTLQDAGISVDHVDFKQWWQRRLTANK
ncbi:NAD(P)-binding protein [Saitoella complicata NRRL Y-17804]|uniref:RmlD-like substrate binding domain-containing protein n=1 Tax=Saitoella complicata (strain BCRC 22490 / CBS 7301 / JCM 7358 / NBRC 10748 / NRRL Y-17804) TaxID=698492 RepID=A0A0E9NS86_SAICN|nr:NAD(P)-binding protein [Saitoella complicata NRRL Y-17804]ODQ54157.1 NAD(P)-binding protein [Saitoella complicata NRRL Y-17804]GAO52305.1 hypothetical protein G7K_6384-t1 [Saitoella complicata NRRL Y-17804]